MKIKGKVNYQNLGPGFWGILGEDGQKWRPESLPKELQKEGLKVSIEAQKSASQISAFMWGKAIKINHYQIID